MRRRSRALLLLMVLCGCREAIVHDLDETSANRVQLSLLNAGIAAEKTRSGDRWDIEVPPEALGPALEIVAASRAIRREQPGATAELSMLMSREERTEVMMRNSALLLERTLEGLPEVLEARVHVGGAKRESASVVVVAVHEAPGAVEEIRAVTAASLGIAPDLIRVLLRVEPPRRVVQVQPQSDRSVVLAAIAVVVLAVVVVVRVQIRSRRHRPEVPDLVGELDVF